MTTRATSLFGLLLLILTLQSSLALQRGSHHSSSLRRNRTQRFLMQDDVVNDTPAPVDPPSDPPVVPKTAAPVAPPTQAPRDPVSSPLTDPPAPTAIALPPADSPPSSPAPTPQPSPSMVPLQEFVVTFANNRRRLQQDVLTVTRSLQSSLLNSLQKEYYGDDLVDVELRVEATLPEEQQTTVQYSGDAIFDVNPPAASDLQQSQKVILQDATFQQGAGVTSVGFDPISAPTDPPSSGDTPIGLVAGLAVGAGVALAVALFVAYRYWSTPPPPPLPEKERAISVESRQKPFQEPQQTRELPGPEDGHGSVIHDNLDDFSLDGIESQPPSYSNNNILLPMNKSTQVYLQQRQMEKENNLVKRAHTQKQHAIVGESSDDESNFSFTLVGSGNANDSGISDDEVYISELSDSHDAVEVGMNGIALVGGGGLDSILGPMTSTKKSAPPEKNTPKKSVLMWNVGKAKTPKPVVKDVPFDERPFDEQEPELVDEPIVFEATEPPLAPPPRRTRNGNKTQGSEEDGLGEFLRERRAAKRAARKSASSKKTKETY